MSRNKRYPFQLDLNKTDELLKVREGTKEYTWEQHLLIAVFEDFLRHVVGSSLHKPLEAVGTEVADVEFEAELEVFEGQEGAVVADGNGCE